MRILGIETATRTGSIGVAGCESDFAEIRFSCGATHAERLAGAVNYLLEIQEIRISDLDGIAVSIGPGSFTGLRIGLGLAKGLAFGAEKPLYAVPTMEAMVSQAPPWCRFACVLLRARTGEMYRSLYHWNGKWVLRVKPETVTEERIFAGIPDEPVLFLGEGSRILKKTITEERKGACFLAADRDLPSGLAVARIGAFHHEKGQRADIQTLAPQYVQRFKGVA
jgi:tRNA threonylcarbamoyladenosine biosynthesis protein TsaB